MIKESIKIKNFGPLEDVQIEDIRPFTVLIGESASGKSTLLKVLILMRYLYKMHNIRAYLKNAGISKIPFRFNFLSLLSPELKSCLSAGTEISYTVEIDETCYSITYSGKQKKLVANTKIADAHLAFFKEVFVAETRNLIPQWFERGGSIRGKALDFYFQQTFEEFVEATNQLKEQDMSFVGFKLNVSSQGAKGKKLYIESQRKESQGQAHPRIELQQASSGVQTATSLMTLVQYFVQHFSFNDAFKRSVLSYLFAGDNLTKYKPAVEVKDFQQRVHLHIEEPELSLYPEAQRKLVNQMIDLLAPTFSEDSLHPWSVSSIIATHSPYIINQLNVLFEAYYAHREGRNTNTDNLPLLNPDDVDVYLLTRGRAHSLKRIDDGTNHQVLDTFILSAPLDEMADTYFKLRGELADA